MLDEMVRKLAEARRIMDEYREQMKALQVDVDAEIEERFGGERRRLVALLETAATEVLDADDALRAAAVAEYEATQDKRPHPAVTVKVYTTLSYEEADASAYCREYLWKALKLDRREFEKAARVLEPEFVTFEVEPKATVATDLSAYVGEEYQAG